MRTKPGRERAGLRGAQVPCEVRPGEPFSDLRGRQPVRITVEGRNLVACGFRDQRVEIRSGSVSAVVLDRGRSLTLLDRDGRMLLRAAGDWNSSALGLVCKRASLPRPAWMDHYGGIRADGKHPSARAWPRAPGYRKLRVRPPGFIPARIVLAGGAVAAAAAGLGAAVALALQLPASAGSVRSLLVVAGGAAGAAGGLWLFTAGVRTGRAAVRWAAASRQLRSVAPWSPFYLRADQHRREQARTAAMVAAVAAATGWGPVAGVVTLVHGSPWGVASLICSALLTAALPVLAGRTARRIRDRRRAIPEDLLEGIW